MILNYILEGFKLGDYCLATKFQDGNPNDHWGVGYYAGSCDDRHVLVLADGLRIRYGGFRKIKKITSDKGSFILSNAEEIIASDKSLWGWLKRIPSITKSRGVN